jgi:acetyl-CoA carboxylase carboxyltransferase component
MVNVVANSVVPKFTVVVGNSYGAGNYAMCGRAYDPRLMLAWPTAQIAVMGGKQASDTLLSIRLQQMGRDGVQPGEAEQSQLLDEIRRRYERQADPYYAAARLWVDALIDPAETRDVIARGIAMADRNHQMPPFVTGVLQT